jgi:DNA-binding MarR family transcriptional regulator
MVGLVRIHWEPRDMDRISKSQFDRLLYQPTRFAVIAHLYRGEAPFVDICRVLGIKSAGALSAHAKLLEDAGYIEMRKSFVGRKARTLLALTTKGREALAGHKAALDSITDVPMEAAE